MTAGSVQIPEGVQIAWQPFPGKQSLYVTCPVEDVFYGGSRGSAKSQGLLGAWGYHARQWGKFAKGMIVRPEIPQLDELIEEARDIYERVGATWQAQKKQLSHPVGWRVKFRPVDGLEAASKYKGQNFTFIGIEEMDLYPTPDPIDRLRACLRPGRGAPLNLRTLFRGNGNPGGVGHNWIKFRYIDPRGKDMLPFQACALCGAPLEDDREFVCDCPEEHRDVVERLFIPATINDNPVYKNDAQYKRNLAASASGDLALLRAWLYGEWDIPAGGMFDDLWQRCRPETAPFPIPDHWYVDRGYDDGDTAPYAVLWFAESNGEEIEHGGRTLWFPRGTLFVIAEDYGWNGTPNEGSKRTRAEIAQRIKDRAEEMRRTGFFRGEIHPGPADNQIWAVQDGECIADRFEAEGIYWERSAKGRGSRKAGWSKLRDMLLNNQAAMEKGRRAEKPGLYVFKTCPQTIRTLKGLPRDKRDRDDVDTKAEDHIADVLRYRATAERYGPVTQTDPMGV